MARPGRLNQPGAWYPVTSRGNDRKAIYRDDADRRHFVELFTTWPERFGLRLHAYVLMDNHFHLLLETPGANLSRAMQWLNTSYTVWFNRRHQRAGHVLQGRFKAVLMEAQSWALGLSRYIHLNPCRLQKMALSKAQQRARRQGVGQRTDREVLRQRLRLLREYPWSSYRAYAGYQKPAPWLQTQSVLALGGGRAWERRRHYREDCEAELKGGDEESSPWKQVVGGLVLGSEEFVQELREKLDGRKAGQSSQQLLVCRPNLRRSAAPWKR
jgi:putative transposase